MTNDQPGQIFMRWEEIASGPGKRQCHTCNAVEGGKFVYVFGGFDGEQQCLTNQVEILDTGDMLWSKPLMKGTPPVPREGHSCTTVGDRLFVFGGTDGKKSLKDLHILDTLSNSWVSPSLSDNGPEARQGHSAALADKRLFIFGGWRKFGNIKSYYDDLYILDTETYSWNIVVTSGNPPSNRSSHTCSSWLNKIIVIGGKDSLGDYLSDVHILDADSLVWCKLNTTGQLLSPRCGHTTVSLDNKLFIFGGYSDEQNLYDDVHVLDLEKSTWTKVFTAGNCPPGIFSMAGDRLHPDLPGVLVFVGGCQKNLEAVNNRTFFLHTKDDAEHLYDKASKKRAKLASKLDSIGVRGLQKVDAETYLQQLSVGPSDYEHRWMATWKALLETSFNKVAADQLMMNLELHGSSEVVWLRASRVAASFNRNDVEVSLLKKGIAKFSGSLQLWQAYLHLLQEKNDDAALGVALLQAQLEFPAEYWGLLPAFNGL